MSYERIWGEEKKEEEKEKEEEEEEEEEGHEREMGETGGREQKDMVTDVERRGEWNEDRRK